MDSTQANTLAHKLEAGERAKKELENCDSTTTILTTTISSYTKLNKSLKAEIDLSNKQIGVKEGIVSDLEKKFLLCDDERGRARRQRYVWGGVGVLAGVVTGIIISIFGK